MRLPHLIARRDKSRRPSLDGLFVLSYAHARLEREHRLSSRDAGAVVLHPVPSAALDVAGWWEKLLCAVFSFEDESKRPTYGTCNYKWGAFYPISPVPSNNHRDTERERLLKAQLRAEDTVEPELGAGFPLWESQFEPWP